MKTWQDSDQMIVLQKPVLKSRTQDTHIPDDSSRITRLQLGF
jgi:hypothetical protein